MATGRSVQLTGQTGEYLVASEMCRRGFITTTFTANVPHYDIIASDEFGSHLPVQVKAIKGHTWQLNIDHFAEIKFDGDKQIIGKMRAEPLINLVYVFVRLIEYGKDEFYIFRWRDLQRIVIEGHRKYLEKHGGIRPRNPKSMHTAVKPHQLEEFRDNWDLIKRLLDPNH
jgi:hypothetical protein